MQWDNPRMLLGLAVLPLVAGLLVWARSQQARAAASFAMPAMRARLLPPQHWSRAWLKGLAIVAGLALVIVASAGPRFGLRREPVPQRGVDLMVLLDVSRSMTADDVTPNRLERAKSDIRDLLLRLHGDRAGLIAFAGKPALRVPLTSDLDLFREVLDEIDTQSAPYGGTRIGDAILKGLETFSKRSGRQQVLLLISDGEDQGSQPDDAARLAAQRGVRILTVGLGDSNKGGRVPPSSQASVDREAAGPPESADKEHWSRLDGATLTSVALISRGAYLPVGTRVYDLGQIYEDYLARLPQSNLLSGAQRYHERYQLFLALGMLLLAVDMATASRRSDSQLPSGGRMA
jgi:Ca-activated chloride channel homolog